MLESTRIPVRVCAPSRPFTTRTGKTKISQEVVIDRGEDSPLVVTRVYWGDTPDAAAARVLPAGPYTARLRLYLHADKDERGYARERLAAALGDYQPAGQL